MTIALNKTTLVWFESFTLLLRSAARHSRNQFWDENDGFGDTGFHLRSQHA